MTDFSQCVFHLSIFHYPYFISSKLPNVSNKICHVKSSPGVGGGGGEKIQPWLCTPPPGLFKLVPQKSFLTAPHHNKQVHFWQGESLTLPKDENQKSLSEPCNDVRRHPTLKKVT